MGQRIVLVGHCGVDAPRLEREVSRICPKAEVMTVNSEEQLHEIVEEGADLLLINRQLPYGFEAEEGVELMRDLQQMIDGQVKMMLVSDMPDAQDAARHAGAVAGFGKADLGSGKIADILKAAMKGQAKPN